MKWHYIIYRLLFLSSQGIVGKTPIALKSDYLEKFKFYLSIIKVLEINVSEITWNYVNSKYLRLD